ncbi:checkpoint protein kinase [Niveomyces insectorum RCEF 264]|uniref:Checkpoint protein kinase n=1 Tax=Niveomyces insectorum RCEF 264 TaxID=1081102 RepID=A0A167XV44_9HYPO|nr:checkpoint protein kinase [Niveomyces insectorum RCEF 264]
MATASPTPLGQGSHFTSLGRRTSARQALRRPPSRSQMGPTPVAVAPAGSKRSSTAATGADSAHQPPNAYSTLHDSSDDEMPIPMKLSALTKALLNDGVPTSSNGATAAGTAGASSSSGPALTTRRRSALNRSTSSAAGAESDNQQHDRPAVRQTRRHVRAASSLQQAASGTHGTAAPQQPTAARSTSPPPSALLSGESSPAPRKRVVRLSATTPAGGMVVQPPLRRSLSASKHANSRRAAGAAGAPEKAAAANATTDEKGTSQSDELPATSSAALLSGPVAPGQHAEAASAAMPQQPSAPSTSYAAETVNTTPANGVRRVQIVVGSSAGRSSSSRHPAARLSASSSALRSSRQTEATGDHHSDDAAYMPNKTPASSFHPSQHAESALHSFGGSASSGSALAHSGSQEAAEQQQQQLLQTAPPSSMRIKRLGKVLGGGFLSGPARRGRRRTSDEEGDGNSPDDMLQQQDQYQQHQDHEGDALVSSQDNALYGSAVQSGSQEAGGARSGTRSPYYGSYGRDYAATGSPVSGKSASAQRAGSLRSRASKADFAPQYEPQQQQTHEQQEPLRRRSIHREDAAAASSPPPPAKAITSVAAAAAPARPNLPSAHDQENEAPSYYVRPAKPNVGSVGVTSVTYDNDQARNNRPLRAALQPTAAKAPVSTSNPAAPSAAAAAGTAAPYVSPERKILAAISRNTPHRPAPPPPPPKMSVLETATAATAGAAATAQANKKPRVLLKVNGRSYQRVDCVGRGGSGKVYKVTAENGKMFAMKRVSLENADDSTVRGYLGEIDLLKKLSGVDRVIQLFDFEMNKEKQMLSLLMELGELDLYSLLRMRQAPESAKLDPVFVRYYWKEMLECLQAVHAHDIVHSDLKPANFVLVKGRLKLIDFGIANAIQTEMTVNVHRETQNGTPNYMSPESLMDAQQYAFTAHHNSSSGSNGSNNPGGFFLGAKATAGGTAKLMKLGKPSDIWSLGCILYQMVYGLPPFGHISHQMARCQAIITWAHAIEFPARGLGGVAVPPSLLATMRRCLTREQHLRPTCTELLAPTDAFLYPESQPPAPPSTGLHTDGNTMPITEELLGRIIQSVVTRCRERLPTEGEMLAAWPAAYWASVRRAVREEK